MGLQHSRHRQEALHQHHHGLAEGSGDAAEVPAPAGRQAGRHAAAAAAAVGSGLTKGWDPLCPQSLIPDIRPCLAQEAVVDLHPEEAALSGAEDEEQEHSDQDLQIRRTVTQVGRRLIKPFYIRFSFLLLPKQSQTGGNSLFPDGCSVSVVLEV